MQRVLVGLVVATLAFLITTALAQEDEFKRHMRSIHQEWDATRQEQIDVFEDASIAWRRMVQEQREEWEQMKAEISRIWLDSLTTTKKEWVDYSDHYSTRSYVNLEKGDMVLATMIEASEARKAEESRKRIAQQLVEMLSPANEAGRPILEGQIADRSGQLVTQQTVDRYLEEEVFLQIREETEPIVGKDGVARFKFTVIIKLIPEHLLVRAKLYVTEVWQQAQRFGLQPELVMAVIHTESHFNPLARSPVPAYGLMQLIPRFAAREAYRFLYRQDHLLTPEYLYVPKNNIELGTGYLYILMRRYFAMESHPQKNLYLTICGYNWGPIAIRQKIVRRHSTLHLNPDQLYMVLRQRTPRETRRYLHKVTQRMAIYRPIFHSR